MKKLVNAITFLADYALGGMLVTVGLAVMVGGFTGLLWL